MADTKEQILDAAESLFSEYGIEAVPLRRIIAEAGVNSAAIHYHFGSKKELVRAVFARRFDPVNRERIDLLDAVDARAGGGRPRVEEVLYAIVAPPFRLGHGTEVGEKFRRLSGRLLTERPGYLEVIFNDLFREVEQRFERVVQRALPELPPNERAWRKYMAVGSMVFILREQDWIRKQSGGLCDTADVEGAIQRLVQFMAAGLKAPVLEIAERAEQEVLVPTERKGE